MRSKTDKRLGQPAKSEGKETRPNYELRPKQTIETRLTEELELLRTRFGISETLQVLWKPGKQAESEIERGKLLHGETVGHTIYIYDEPESEALETLRHEALEHFVVDQNESDYVVLVNHLIEAFNIVHRNRREELVQRLSQLV